MLPEGAEAGRLLGAIHVKFLPRGVQAVPLLDCSRLLL